MATSRTGRSRPDGGAARPGLLGLLTMVVGTLIVAAVALGVGAQVALAGQERRIADLTEQAARDAAEPLPSTPPPTRMDAANRNRLAKRLTAVRTADARVESAVQEWLRGQSELSAVWKALGACMFHVDVYDTLAARYPPAQLGDLPAAIDLRQAETDCGRATIERRADRGTL